MLRKNSALIIGPSLRWPEPTIDCTVGTDERFVLFRGESEGRDGSAHRGQQTMAMKVGIAGFAGSGKSTVFQWLTGVRPDPAKVQSGQTGHAAIPDARLDWLFDHYKPKRKEPVYPAIDFLDTPGLLPDERRDNPRRLSILREAGGLLVVLGGFGANQPADELR